MGSPAFFGGQRYARYPSTPYIVVLTGGAANTKGSYVELISSTAFQTFSVRIHLNNVDNSDALVDIAIGAAASEQIIVANVPADRATVSRSLTIPLPLALPAGTRISARVQKTAGATDVYSSIEICATSALGRSSLQRCITYGAATADSGGTSVNPGGTPGTKGSYSEITASTTTPIEYLLLCIGNQNNGARTQGYFALDVAIGAAGSEQRIILDETLYSSSSQEIAPEHLPFEVDILAGSRLACRAQSQTTNTFDVVLLGVG